MSAYTFRPYVPEDLNFIRSSWGTSYLTGCEEEVFLTPKFFHAYHRPIRDRILERETIAIIVCSATDAPEQLIGWILVEKPVDAIKSLIVHYIYVKEIYKREGIATELLSRVTDGERILFTHMTERAQKILDNKIENDTLDFHYLYRPHLI